MNIYQIPMIEKSESYVISLPDGKSVTTIKALFAYNAVGKYWTMTVSDKLSGKVIASNVPYLRCQKENVIYGLFRQLWHLGIGDPIILKRNDVDSPNSDSPEANNLITDFELYWCK